LEALFKGLGLRRKGIAKDPDVSKSNRRRPCSVLQKGKDSHVKKIRTREEADEGWGPSPGGLGEGKKLSGTPRRSLIPSIGNKQGTR